MGEKEEVPRIDSKSGKSGFLRAANGNSNVFVVITMPLSNGLLVSRGL
jgi:hypothetical protein